MPSVQDIFESWVKRLAHIPIPRKDPKTIGKGRKHAKAYAWKTHRCWHSSRSQPASAGQTPWMVTCVRILFLVSKRWDFRATKWGPFSSWKLPHLNGEQHLRVLRGVLLPNFENGNLACHSDSYSTCGCGWLLCLGTCMVIAETEVEDEDNEKFVGASQREAAEFTRSRPAWCAPSVVSDHSAQPYCIATVFTHISGSTFPSNLYVRLVFNKVVCWSTIPRSAQCRCQAKAHQSLAWQKIRTKVHHIRSGPTIYSNSIDVEQGMLLFAGCLTTWCQIQGTLLHMQIYTSIL